MNGENTSERAMKHEVLRWLDELRSGVEQCVQPYLAGYFYAPIGWENITITRY